MTTVLTLGTFDMLHVGHLELFRACREMAGPDGAVVVAVNRDEFVRQFKGQLPVIPYQQRREMVAACRDVDLAVCNAGDDHAAWAIVTIDPDIIVVGDDWRDRDYLGQLGVTQGWLDRRGIRVVYVSRTTGVSTTDLRWKILSSAQPTIAPAKNARPATVSAE